MILSFLGQRRQFNDGSVGTIACLDHTQASRRALTAPAAKKRRPLCRFAADFRHQPALKIL
jgi:hypothetical protein